MSGFLSHGKDIEETDISHQQLLISLPLCFTNFIEWLLSSRLPHDT